MWEAETQTAVVGKMSDPVAALAALYRDEKADGLIRQWQ